MQLRTAVPFLLVSAGFAPLAAQVRTTQPPMINIIREFEKPGHFGAHEAIEARWTALNRANNYPYTYVALSAVSGPNEVWWVTAYDGMAAFGKASTWGSDNPAYTSAVAKIAAEDGEHITNVMSMQAAAMPDASYGAYPDLAKQRVFSVATFTVRPGNEAAFTAMAKQYAALMKAKNIPAAWRAYEVVGGGPGGSILVFSSYPSWDALEAQNKASDAAMAAGGPEVEALGKGWRESVVSVNTRYFNVSPRMSLVPKEYMADPFWGKP
jgi:hypothetical protein